MSILKDVVGGFWSRIGLYLGYVSIGVSIALGVTAVWFYNKNDALNTTVSTLQTTVATQKRDLRSLQQDNAAQDKAISDLKDLRERDSEAVSGLVSDYREIANTTSFNKQKLKDLEAQSETVRAYLHDPLPESVRRVLNEQPAPASSSHGHED